MTKKNEDIVGTIRSLDVMSESDTALKLGLSRMTLQRARNRGEIPFYKVGRRVLYSISQIFEFLKRREHNAPQSQEEGEAK